MMEVTHMSYSEIMEMPYVLLVIGLIDIPQVTTDSDTKKNKVIKPQTANDQINSLNNIFG